MYQGDAILRRPMTSPQGEEEWLYAAAARGTQVSYIYIIYTREHEITWNRFDQFKAGERFETGQVETRVAAMHGVTFAQVATVLVSLHASVLQ